jgi:restriction endonuclease S subunit
MRVFTIALEKVITSERDDFDFHNPEVDSIRQTFAEHVASVPLEDVCISIHPGKTAARNAYVSSGVRILKVKNVTGTGLNWDEYSYVTAEFYAKAPQAHVQNNDILMLCSAHSKIYIGRCDIIEILEEHVKDGRCSTVGELIIIRPDQGKILPEYLLTYLRLPIVQAEISRMVKGQSAHLYARDLKHLRVVRPSRDKQQMIAERLMSAQAEYRRQIAEAELMLENTRSQVENLILQLVDDHLEI